MFVHSGLMDARVWEPQFEALAEQHEVVRYDRRGFGRSDAPSGPFSDLWDLRALLDTLEITRCALVGCAEGAGLAFDLAFETPGRDRGRRRVLAAGDRLPLARPWRRCAR